ncbi:hypothetical protein A5747_13390 [Mycobacterium sp. IS-836]|uniref:phage portal protein n=1 Tax=Mycobacterium sp. IS-836 TaxID=1834160 RepID=UPI00096D02B7|nr:phage portal protein [Mycobacterium sp. IS-836]OMC55381.1 hypothetical protein A5747_13390 [Mycobacterium sp. IS-836]
MASIEIPADINASNVRQYLNDVVWEHFEKQRQRLEYIHAWSRNINKPEFLVPAHASKEKRALMNLAKTPWLALVVEAFTQTLLVDGYRTQGSTGNVAGPWETWNANRMHARQMSIHRAALRYGFAFGRALPGEEEGAKAVLRGLSPMRCFGLYEDQVADDYPVYALEILPNGSTVRFYNDHEYYDIPMSKLGMFPENAPITTTEHNIGVTPIVRYVNTIDLDGIIKGEVEDLISVASCLDKTKFDRLLIQHFNSWRVRWATGLDNTDSDVSQDKFLQQLSQSETLVSTSVESRFGTLDATPMGDIIQAYERDLSDLEDSAQLPPNWSGGASNVGPDALEQMRANTRNKIAARQVTFGDGHNTLLRLGARIEGDEAAANDYHASVTWIDADVRSLGQLVDAWGKAHALLGAPARALWRKITTQEEAAEWDEYFESDDPTDKELKYWGVNQPVPAGEGANAPQPNRQPGNRAVQTA